MGTNDFYEHTLVSQSEYFTIDKLTGNIVAKAGVPVGKYDLSFRSKERQSATSLVVESTATVDVVKISEKSAKSGIPLRMTGLTLPNTCKQVKIGN